MVNEITFYDVGSMEYEECWNLQNFLHERCVRDGRNSLIVVEHPAVITLGKNADPGFVLFDRKELLRDGVAVIEVDRGGEATLHNPGQLVIYPILRLADWGTGPKQYVRILEDSIIELLRSFGVEGTTELQYPGVWVGLKKICAVGVRIKDRVTLHGLALNISNDLALFSKIVPCGIFSRGVTSVMEEVGERPDFGLIVGEFLKILAKNLNSGMVEGDARLLAAEVLG